MQEPKEQGGSRGRRQSPLEPKQGGPREEPKDWITWSLALGSFAAVFLLTMVFLCQYAILVQNHYRVVALRDRQKVLEREKDLMQLELQSLSSLERVEGVVTSRLKMVPPAHRQVLDLRKIQVKGQVAIGSTVKN
ncbi:MAG: hypothetical protein KF760_13380 [Candidatus Eremiobacteraeota bacterium]|nr:hypothetical protein [Candidatus Eremiobacteraeota bacterium]MCW5870253.1 hypothetical protein [Candidatus Eremiobacteraeota bacterium]